MVLMFGQGFDSLQLHSKTGVVGGIGFFIWGCQQQRIYHLQQPRFPLYLFCKMQKRMPLQSRSPSADWPLIILGFIFNFWNSMPLK